MHCSILTLFPEAIRPYLDESILGIAQAQGKLRVDLVDFRNCALDPHRTVDDRPFGGGPGMVLKPEPIFAAIEEVEQAHGQFHKVLLCPRGRTFDQRRARELSQQERLLFLCGRYEGYDERIRQGFAWEEISLGDFVLAGGELAALVVLEAAVRLIPGVLGCAESAVLESFEGEWLDHPQYTRPRQFRDMPVPEILFSGDHQKVARWRHEQARLLTAAKQANESGRVPTRPTSELTPSQNDRLPRDAGGHPAGVVEPKNPRESEP
ncbi:MAG: tRNA (guanosine(37)-N1)-methyltransferase TrmD [Planctomycetes bacterium]|nr:tRNA (guanosine(37)-N1)-methyltransferase TrmD [Planctomycetota bacterium]